MSQLTEETLQSVIHAVGFVIRCATLDKLNADAFKTALLKKTDLNEPRRALFLNAWTTHSKDGALISSALSSAAPTPVSTTDAKAAAPPLPITVASALKLGQLVGFEWKLGVGVSSSHCRALNSPFVAIVLRIAQPDGRISAHALELTLRQFQDFSKTFHDIAAQLETV